MKRILLISFLLLILTVGAVSAADDNMTCEDSASDGTLSVDSSTNEITTVEETFDNLNDLIEKTPENSVLKLDKNYSSNYSSYNMRINITKSITIDGNGHTLNGNGSSGIFHINASNVILKNIVFKNSRTYSEGAIMGHGFNLINCSFIKCRALDGGAVYIESDSEERIIQDCNFINCTGSSGGAIYSYKSKVRILNCSFTGGYASYSGGSITIIGNTSDSLICDCRFEDSTAYGMGGAIRAEGFLNINGCTFMYCDAREYGGGAIDFDNGNISMTNCSFELCHASMGAGCLGIGSAKANITNCSFFDCLAWYGDAGSIYFYDIEANVLNCSFTDCHAYLNGGGIYFSSDATGKVMNCSFTDCYGREGGAIFANDNVRIISSSFKDCNGREGSIVKGGVIKDCDLAIIIADDLKTQYSSGEKYRVKVYKNESNLAENTEVTIKINGKAYKTIKTNSKGIATFKVAQSPGTYKITIKSLGMAESKKLTVKHIVTLKTATLKKSAKRFTLRATLAKVNGKYLKKKTITFKINGKKVATAKTNNKGVAKVTIKNPNVVKNLKVGKKVTYQATYLKDTVKKTTKIKK